MKHLLLTTIAAVLLVGCGESQSSAPSPEPTTAKAPDISIHDAARRGDIVAVKQHLAAGSDLNAKASNGTPLLLAATFGHKEIAELLIAKGVDVNAVGGLLGWTPLHWAASEGRKEVAELLIGKGADVNAKDEDGKTPLDWAEGELTDLLRKHGGKTGDELKAEGK